MKQRIHFEGGDPFTSSPDEYAADIDREETLWAKVVKATGMRGN